MRKKTTIKDIAKQLDVSNSLVSFVLNGKSKEKRISDEMKSKVLELAKSLDYTPNYLAKSLRSGKSNTLGLIVADISNPFYGMLARHIEIEASKYGYKVIFSNSDENESKFTDQLGVLQNGQVDGLIITPPIGSEEELLKLKKMKIPFVVVERIFKNVVTHSVVANNFQAGYNATEKLIKNNRKKIALVNLNFKLLHMVQREEGFIAAMKNNGLAVNKSLIKHVKFSHEGKYVMEAIQDIVKNGADGLLFTTSKLGVQGIQCLSKLGIKIPQSMSIVSFDNINEYRVSSTPITVVEQPLEQISKESIRIIINIIENKYADGHYENVELEANLISRESCL